MSRTLAAPAVEMIEEFEAFGIRAFTTTRAAGSYSTTGREPVGEVLGRWYALQAELGRFGPRFTTAPQVHGNVVHLHGDGWAGWLRAPAADGHASVRRGTGMAVTVADCIPVFIAHDSGAIALLHSGWRGTVARIVEQGVGLLVGAGLDPRELRVHLGPGICGECYEVSPDVHQALTGERPAAPRPVDLRAVITRHAESAGVREITTSPWCTRCHNERFYSHRAGDSGRQLGVMIAMQ